MRRITSLPRREPERILLSAFSFLAVSVMLTTSSLSSSASFAFIIPIPAAFATTNDIGELLGKYHDAPFFGHHYDSESNTYKDDSGNEFECVPSEDGSVYYYEYMGEFYRCTYGLDEGGVGEESGGGSGSGGQAGTDGSKDNTEGSTGDMKEDDQGNNAPAKYYDKHFIGHSFDPKAKSYVDADGVEYKCGHSHNGKLYYSFNGDYYRCDDLNKARERFHVGYPVQGHKYDAKKDAYFDEDGNEYPCNHKYRGVYYYEFEGDFYWCEEKSP